METVNLFAVFPLFGLAFTYAVSGLRSDSRQIVFTFDILILKHRLPKVNMFRTFRVFKIVSTVQNIAPKRYYSIVRSIEADHRNRLSDYTLTKDGLKSLSRFFEVRPKLLATTQYSDEIAWNSLGGESFVHLASGKQQECLDSIASNVGSLSCEDLILMLIAIDSLEMPLHHGAMDAIQIEISKRLPECSSKFPSTSQTRINRLNYSFICRSVRQKWLEFVGQFVGIFEQAPRSHLQILYRRRDAFERYENSSPVQQLGWHFQNIPVHRQFE